MTQPLLFCREHSVVQVARYSVLVFGMAAHFLIYGGIDYGDCSEVHYVAYGSVD